MQTSSGARGVFVDSCTSRQVVAGMPAVVAPAKEIRIAIVGVGNCASALLQGIVHYTLNPNAPGVIRRDIGGYAVSNIRPVLAFDVDARKVRQPLPVAMFALPNCCYALPGMPAAAHAFPAFADVIVQLAPRFDGVASHMVSDDLTDNARPCPMTYEQALAHRDADLAEGRTSTMFLPRGCYEYLGKAELNEPHVWPYTLECSPADFKAALVARFAAMLRESKADVLINYLPVGSTTAVEFWAEVCLAAKVAMVNAMPVFIASNSTWACRFADAGVVILGDDMRSQFGASVVSQMLEELAVARGHVVKEHVQINVGYNTDFHNMEKKERLVDKQESKESVIKSVHAREGNSGGPATLVFAGPACYIPFCSDTKKAYFDLKLEGWGGAPVSFEAKLVVEDSPNSAGIVADALRFAMVAKEMGVVGAVCGASANLFKHPPIQLPFATAQAACKALAAREASDLCRPDLCALTEAFFEEQANEKQRLLEGIQVK